MVEPRPEDRFPTTQWSRVVEAGGAGSPAAGEALATLCHAYWYPIYAFIRRRGHSPEEAQDLTQEFFAYAIERNLVVKADPSRGRFRSYLRTVCGRLLSDHRDRRNARKRGEGKAPLSIDAGSAEGRYALEPAHELTPDRVFDRTWALTLLGRVLGRLRAEYEAAGRESAFDELSGALTRGAGSVPYRTVAEKLGTSEGAVRVAVHRLRRRYGTLLREEIAGTVVDPAEVDDEIRALFAALDP